MAKAPGWNGSDGEGRRPGERTGLDTRVVLAVNAVDLPWGPIGFRGGGHPLSPPPGEYGRKPETQRNWRGPAQAAERVV